MAYQPPAHPFAAVSVDSIYSDYDGSPTDKELDYDLFYRDPDGTSVNKDSIQSKAAQLFLEQFYQAAAANLMIEKNDREKSIEVEMKTRGSETLYDQRSSLGQIQLENGMSQMSSGKDSDQMSLQHGKNDDRYLAGYKLVLVFLGLLLSMLLISLDQTIVATAQPQIVSVFDALDQIAWVSSAYFLTQAGLMLPVGQILTVISTKTVYLASISLFETGSFICGAAARMEVLILGRAIAGVGAAGILNSIFSIIAEVTKLEDRPLLFGAFGIVYAISSSIGPLLGGVFTDHVSWRWCFYINLPFGALAIASIVLFLDSKGTLRTEESKSMTLKQKFLSIDYIGTTLILGFVTSLILALQWGGNQKPWTDKGVIATLVVGSVLLIMFCVWEYHLGSKAMVPLELLKRRTQLGATAEGFFLYLLVFLGTYYLPLWYQSKGASASHSGVDILPFMLSIIISGGMSGALVTKTNRYWWTIVLAPPITSIGAGLLFTVNPHTPNPHVIGYQILLGLGTGAALQNMPVAIQTEYAKEEHLIPQGTSLLNFVQTLGGVVGVTAGAAVFGNQLATNVIKFAPGLSPEQTMAIRSSVTAIFELPKDLQTQAIKAYSESLDWVFLIGVPAAALATISGLFVKNYNIRERSPTGGIGGGMA